MWRIRDEVRATLKFVIAGSGMRLVSDPIQPRLSPLRFELHELAISDYPADLAPRGKDIDILTIFYGRSYAQMATSIMAPSLWSHNLCQEFFRKKDIVHHIYCREVDMEYHVTASSVMLRANWSILGS